jgi:hypothetical protein
MGGKAQRIIEDGSERVEVAGMLRSLSQTVRRQGAVSEAVWDGCKRRVSLPLPVTCLRACTRSGSARKRGSMRVARCRQPSDRTGQGRAAENMRRQRCEAASCCSCSRCLTLLHVVIDECAGELLRVVQQLNLQYAIVDQQIATRLTCSGGNRQRSRAALSA